MHILRRGILISAEGIDGSGKTTLCHSLTEALRKEQFPVILTKEPGSTLLGNHIRTIIQQPGMSIASIAEYLLFAADRAQHFKEIVIPVLEKKQIVISDRLTDSSLVYQGFGRHLDCSMIKSINQWTTQGINPDLTLYLAIPADLAFKRLQSRNKPLTSFEQEDRSFTERLIHGFETIFANQSRVIRLDATQAPEAVAQEALIKVKSWITTQLQ